MKRVHLLSFVSVMILLFFILMALGSNESTEPQKVERPETEEMAAPTQAQEPAAKQQLFNLGDTVSMGNLEVTLNSARWDSGSQFMQPDEGERWLVLDVTIENKADEAAAISSLLMFSLYDEDDYSCDMEIFADTKGSLDGEIGAGRRMRGEIAFSVEENHNQWKFIFEPNIFGFGQAIYLINAEDVSG